VKVTKLYRGVETDLGVSRVLKTFNQNGGNSFAGGWVHLRGEEAGHRGAGYVVGLSQRRYDSPQDGIGFADWLDWECCTPRKRNDERHRGCPAC